MDDHYGTEYLKKDQLIVGQRYRGIGRNFNEAVWNGIGFVGQRFKWGRYIEDDELHYDDDPHYGTFQPLEAI